MKNRGFICLELSQFLEGDDIDGLDIIFPSGDLIEDVISVDLGIFNDASDLELEDLSDDGDLLGFVVPDETIEDDFLLDLFPKAVEIEVLFVDLDIEDDDGFGNYCLFGLDWSLGFFLWLGLFFLSIITEEINIVLILLDFLLSFLLLFNLFLFLLFLLLLLLHLEGLVRLLGELFSTNNGVSLNNREVPGSDIAISLSLFFSEGSKNNSDSSGQAVVSNGDAVSNQELSSSEVLLNESQELVDISKDLGSINLSSFFGDGNGSNCSLEITGGDIEPLVDQSPVVDILTSVELVAS